MPRARRPTAVLRRGAETAAFTTWRLVTRTPVDTRSYSAFLAGSTYTPWRSDEAFQAVLTQVRGHTMVDEARLYELWSLASQLATLDGDILEVGVWRGGSGCLLARRSQDDGAPAQVVLADTFAGVVNAGEQDPVYRGGEHADTSPSIVRELAESMALRNVEVLVGTFPDETAAAIEGRRFKLVHVDVDTYGSAKQVSEWAWPRLVQGGVLVFDDYGTPTTPGVRLLVDEWRGRPGALVIHNLNQHAIVVRTG